MLDEKQKQQIRILGRLVELKRQLVKVSDQEDRAEMAAQALPEYKNFMNVQKARRLLQDEIAEGEQKLRAIVLELHAEHPDQKFYGVQVQQASKTDFDRGAAFAWAIKNNHTQYLQLDEKKFARFILGIISDPETMRMLDIDFVTHTTVPAVSILQSKLEREWEDAQAILNGDTQPLVDPEDIPF